MSFVIDSSLLQNMDTLIRYQNNLLIRKISEEKKWPLAELKKFLPKKQKIKLDEETEFSSSENSKSKVKRSEPNFKIIKKKVIKKKVVKKAKKEETTKADALVSKMKEESSIKKKIIKITKTRKKIVKKITKSVSQNEDVVSIVATEKDLEDNTETIEVQCISYQKKEYYLEPVSEKVYSMNEDDCLVFVGMVEGPRINFDAESAED